MAPATGTENQGTRSLEQLFTEAIAQHEAGRLNIARPIYEKLRSAVGPNPDILHLLGTLYFQQGSPDRGARLIRQAIILRPDPASYYDHFGSAARGTSNLALAETAYGRACIINPASGSAFLNSAIVALETGQAEKAVEKAGQAIHLMPDNTEAWLRLGIALYTIKEYASAAEALDQARDKAPESVEAYFHLQKVHTALRNTQAADKITKQSIALDPGRHELYAHFRSGDLSDITNWSSNFPKRLATIIKPASSNTWEQLAAEYYSEMKYADAAKAAQHAALIAPGLSSPYNSLATTTYHLGEFKRSIRISRHGLFVSPGFGDIGFNLSLSAFSSGDIDTGWRYWPHRLKMSKAPKRFSLPDRWNPDDGAPGHLLIASEQGLGDDILHLSCLPDLLQHVLLVTIETDPRLFPLLKRSFPHLNLIEKQLRSGANGEAIHDYENVQGKHQFTHSLTSGDLPALYRHGPHKVPAGNGYLRVDATMQLEWQTRLSEFGPPPYLGLCWRSGTFITSHRAIRYHTIEELVSEIPTDTFTLVNLQYGDARDEIAGLAAERGITIHDFPDLNQTNELDRVAALMSCLDLVIAPATAALALACAVGVPVIGLEKSYFLYGDENDPMFANLYPVKRPSEPTIVPDRAQRMGEAIRYFLEHGKLPIREP
ncbi:tetratricopeptide repeat protein [uncultured Nisaea sp.]|uniref:tetratricopeptide repeat protein n=1 Tax=uncultured Nisaea sp. TaxID=538215 RepID=UPI0030ED36BE|tara:strand:+ start:4524 stop:6497 length:1974 start_codon:yes stop_codon:yes gene_type:complete